MTISFSVFAQVILTEASGVQYRYDALVDSQVGGKDYNYLDASRSPGTQSVQMLSDKCTKERQGIVVSYACGSPRGNFQGQVCFISCRVQIIK